MRTQAALNAASLARPACRVEAVLPHIAGLPRSWAAPAGPPAMDSRCLPRIAFVHIPKTAGTSLTQALARRYGDLTLPAMTTLDYALYADDALQSFRFYKGHAYRRDYQRFPAQTIRFTVLRDPVARAVSYFQYFRGLDENVIGDPFIREAVSLAKRGSPVELIYSDSPFVIEHLRLGQVRQFLPGKLLKEIAHRQFLSRALRDEAVAEFTTEMEAFDYVLTTEWLSLTFPLLLRELGLAPPIGGLPHANLSQIAGEIDLGDVRRALTDVNGAEFTCYMHVQNRQRAWLETHLRPLLEQTSMAQALPLADIHQTDAVFLGSH